MSEQFDLFGPKRTAPERKSEPPRIPISGDKHGRKLSEAAKESARKKREKRKEAKKRMEKRKAQRN